MLAKTSFLYNSYSLLKIFRLITFFFPSKNFLIHSIFIQQTLDNTIVIVIKYFHIKSFFTVKNDCIYPGVFLNNISSQIFYLKHKYFELILIKAIFDLVSVKALVIFCFNLKKMFSKKYFKIKAIIDRTNLKRSIFYHSISIFVLAVLVFSTNSVRLLSNYIILEFSSTKNHNSFLLFLKSFFYFILVLSKNKKLSKIKGIRLLIKGRFNGHNRARLKQIKIGSIGLQKINTNLDCCNNYCFTKHGIFGIKVYMSYRKVA